MTCHWMISLGLLPVGFAVALGWWATRPSLRSPETVEELRLNACYAVSGDPGEVVFDLPFSPNCRYALLLSSFGDPQRSHQVQLRSEPVRQARLGTFRPIRPLPNARPQPSDHPTENRPQWSQQLREVSWKPSLTEQNSAPHRAFHLHVTEGALDDPQAYARLDSRLVGEGRQVRVYLDTQQKREDLAEGTVAEIIRLLERRIMPKMRDYVGGYRDVDGDGKFTVLLTPWLNRLRNGKTALGGFVRSSDFRPQQPAPFSNQCDMLYLNSRVQPGPHLQALLAHEFTHVVCFSQRAAGTGWFSPPREEDWLNEAIAHVCATTIQENWSNLDYRIDRYLDAPHRYPLVVADYYRAGLWRNHGCRGATYLFLQWCVDRFGPGILRELVHGSARGTENVTQATGVAFRALFRRWSLALMQSKTGNSAEDFAYRSLNLRGQVGRRSLSGPQIRHWNVQEDSRTVSVHGTATAFLELEAGEKPGVRRIHLQADPAARLEVSVVPYSQDRPSNRPGIEPDSGPILAERTSATPGRR